MPITAAVTFSFDRGRAELVCAAGHHRPATLTDMRDLWADRGSVRCPMCEADSSASCAPR
jgi:hypothetical protein